QPEFAGGGGKIVDLLFHGVAHEHQRLRLHLLGLAARMSKDFADLGAATATGNPAHETGEAYAVGDPAGGATFVEAAVVDELHLQPADRRRLAEHFALQLAGGIPGGLPAHGGVEREDQAPALAGLEGRRQSARASDEGVNLRTRGPGGRLAGRWCRSRSAVAILCHSACRGAVRRDYIRSINWPRWSVGAMAGLGGRRLLGHHVLKLERLIQGGGPFGAGGGAAAAALVEGELKAVDERAHLLVRGHVRHARTSAERRLVEVVEGAQPARKQLAIDKAFGKAV